MNIGIVGHEAAKFTVRGEERARALLRVLLDHAQQPIGKRLVSGGCHLGGIDVWAEEEAKALGAYDPDLIFLPRNLSWLDGFKARNIQIAKASDVLHCLVVSSYPPTYAGMRFDYCYHCHTSEHIKSGGCYTLKQSFLAESERRPAYWHLIDNS